MELAHMSLCRKTKHHKIIPIFYLCQPDILEGFPQALEDKLGDSSRLAEIFVDYKKTKEEWKEAFDEWKEALSHLAECREKHYSLTKVVNRRLSTDGGTMIDSEPTWTQAWPKFFSEVVSDVMAYLKRDELGVTDKLIGIDYHLEEMMKKLGILYSDGRAVELVCGEEIRVVTITGLSGIGKTTLAKVVYNKIQHLFQARSFLENIQESLQPLDRLESLQQKLISNLNRRKYPKSSYDTCINSLKAMFKKTRVLIVLDNVHDIKDVEGLAADCNWFGPGSRIILTSSMGLQQVGLVKEAQKHEVKEMDERIALQLFQKHACGQNFSGPLNEYEPLAKKIVAVVGGIPFAIETIGEFLYGGNIDMWQEMLTSLEKNPLEPVYKSFEVAYNLLGKKIVGKEIQQIFLDIACFLTGTDKKVSEYMWRACEFLPTTGIERLHNMCWVKIKENDELWMPDQLQNFGREMVKKEHKDFWKRSRLWNHEEAIKTLEERKGNENVQALGIRYEDHRSDLTSEHFMGLLNLVFLKLDKVVIKGNFNELLSSLLWLDWQGCCSMMTEALSSLNLTKLVILDLSGSQVGHLWDGWKLIMEKAKSLKVLKLIGCGELLESPDFHNQMNLEMLILERCFRLSLIHPSIQYLQKLKSLNLKCCILVGSLPDLGQMPELEELLVDGTSIIEFHLQRGSMKKLKILSACQCKNLIRLPKSIGEITCLTQLVLDDATEIEELPLSITSLLKLRVLSMRGCKKITSLPEDIGNLQSLEKLVLGETFIAILPSSTRKLEKLKVLKMRRTRLASFPDQVTSLGNLEVIDLRECWNLEGEIPSDVNGLLSLRVLRLSYTKISSLPESIGELFHLRVLELCECSQLPVYTIPQRLKERVIRCPTGCHHDHGEFSQFGHDFS